MVVPFGLYLIIRMNSMYGLIKVPAILQVALQPEKLCYTKTRCPAASETATAWVTAFLAKILTIY